MNTLLIVYDSNGGHTQAMARHVARGVESVTDCEACVRSVAKVGPTSAERMPPVPDSGAPFVELQDLEHCDGLILGTPTHFGNMSASLKYFLDCTTPQWFGGKLSGKPAAVFTSTGSLHGGQESTLLSMMQPLLHHGMLITGLPYTLPELSSTRSGGTPYGASHWSDQDASRDLDDTEQHLCNALGARVAGIAKALKMAEPTVS
jgi:NAD(P)H dehydrogenase (quinone)